jgi:hypothetical protein
LRGKIRECDWCGHRDAWGPSWSKDAIGLPWGKEAFINWVACSDDCATKLEEYAKTHPMQRFISRCMPQCYGEQWPIMAHKHM